MNHNVGECWACGDLLPWDALYVVDRADDEYPQRWCEGCLACQEEEQERYAEEQRLEEEILRAELRVAS